MVQTEQQYICIHQCLLAVLEGKENIVGPARVMDDNEGFEGRCGDTRRIRCCLVLGRSLRNASFLLTLTHKCCTELVLSLFIGSTLFTSVSKLC